MNIRNIIARLTPLALSVTLLTASSCKKELDIDYHDIDPLPVIEGTLTPDGARVSITMTTPMDEPMDLTRLTDATVQLTDITAGTGLTLTADPDGYFVTGEGGIIGHDYRLTVTRGDTHCQAVTTMYGPTEIVSLDFSWISMPYDDVAVLQCRFRHTGDNNAYWVWIDRNGEPYRRFAVDNRGVEDGILTAAMMTTRRDTDEEDDKDVLYAGDLITCTIHTITHEMYDYLESLANGSNGPAMFAGQRCLGYFMATTPASADIIFDPDKIEYDHTHATH